MLREDDAETLDGVWQTCSQVFRGAGKGGGNSERKHTGKCKSRRERTVPWSGTIDLEPHTTGLRRLIAGVR